MSGKRKGGTPRVGDDPARSRFGKNVAARSNVSTPRLGSLDITEMGVDELEETTAVKRPRNSRLNKPKHGRTETETRPLTESSGSETESEDEQQPTKKTRRNADGDDWQSQKPRAHNVLRNKLRAKKIERSNLNSHSGIVKSVKLFNFMCHDGFYQEWHPNLNFTVGENGSGKSALLTGLLIGLGAKATLTSRTKSMISLIQKGKDSARTEITLLNAGALSETNYGNEVTIERTISKTGSCGYRLKSDNDGKWRKIKKQELDFILLSFNIQLDNPVAILNQEVAKNFLRTKDPKDKYSLFYQGTLLSKLFALLTDSKTDIDVCEQNLKFHKALIVALKVKVEELNAKLQEYENLKNIKQDLVELELEFIWALVFDEEKNKKKLDNEMVKHDQNIAKLKEGVDNLVARKQKLEDDISPSQGQAQDVGRKIRENEQNIERARKELTKAQKTIQESKFKIRNNKNLMARKERVLEDAKGALEKLQSTSTESEAEAHRVFEEKKQLLTEQRSKAHAEMVSMKNDAEQFQHGLDKAREEMNNVLDTHQKSLRGLDGKKRHLEALQKAGANKFVIFGRNMETLMAKITANMRKFKKPPRGPIAALLTVKNEKYTGLIEYILKQSGFLTTFMVDNGDDLMLLKRLIQESYPRGRLSTNEREPSIRVNTFGDRPHDISNGVARLPECKNLLDMLEVENNDHVVINGLVDYVSAERILMFETNQAAAEVMKNRSRCPPTTKHGWTLEYYRFFPFPNFQAQAMDKGDNRGKFLKMSQRGQINDLKLEIQELQATLDELQPALDSKRRDETRLRKQYDQMKAECDLKRRAFNAAERVLKENETKKYKPPDVASHVEEINEMEAELRQFVDENEAASNMIEEINGKILDLTKEKEELEYQTKKLQKSIESVEEKREKVQQELQRIEGALKKFELKVKDVEAQKQPTVDRLKKCERELERKLQQTEGRGERVNTDRSAVEVKEEFEQVKVKISTMEDHLGDINKLKDDHQKKRTELEKKYKEYRPTYKSFMTLKDLILTQLKFLFKKRTEISHCLTLTFHTLVEQRGYKGQMMIDHEKKELHFFICPDKSSSKRTDSAIEENDRNTKKALVEYSLGLSGGERSFSTICFIMSLWQVMECPFYMLDEFDVFMDAFNRKASQQALIAHAKQFNRNQFFLFSPLDLVEVPSKDDATVIRLKAARPDEADTNTITSFSTDNEAENVDPSSQISQRTRATSKSNNAGSSRNRTMSEKNRPARR